MTRNFKNLLFAIFALSALNACQNKPAEEDYSDTETQTVISGVDTTEGLFAMIYTPKGIMIGRLETEKAPLTVANFVALAEGSMPNNYRKPGQAFYDSMKFHRVISLTNGDNENFMIQGGDPLGTGMGGPGYQFKDEFSDLKMDKPGILAMANSGPGTNGSQFFITLKATPWLNGVHTVFGELISGTEVPFLIQGNDLITRIKILRKGKKAQEYDALNEFNSRNK